ncbi:serine (threonine) protein kinase [Alcanivorax hongdengensis A-11-3]|uniref:Serine (Threonine) protein kinase n=1 Tax=Alcanivorax hongdengensis A-11-3 TaxID=1177179 RepID=L0WEN4_9GAMM|nr:bifunctional protein-serine/threonine kinase/phosphatase [Alcanivorax hongdengensis]EKF75189.1 serine (threonine) protein kinase [Alcanivorax hongdengensis A-11-3]
MTAMQAQTRETVLHPRITAGQCSDPGHKAHNQDALAIQVPEDSLLRTKGLVAALADGLSSAAAGREAAESCVLGFISDYYATPALWSVARSAQRVLEALNRWLCRQTLAGDSHLCTLSLLILRSCTAHLFQVGDSRIWRLRGDKLECLTRDHSRTVGDNHRVLTRVMGGDTRLDVDYRKTDLQVGDIYLLTSDGVHEFLSRARMQGIVRGTRHPEAAARALVEAALANGSDDNLSCQVLRIDALPDAGADEAIQSRGNLPLLPPLAAGMSVDGLTVIRELHASARSHVYLVKDADGELSVLKAPSVNLEDQRAALERFVLEGWIASRLRSPHLLRALPGPEHPSGLYQRLEYVDGVTLQTWLREHPDASVEERLYLADQILNGLRALHRGDVIHGDLKPDNLMVDRHGRVHIIDFGSCHCRGMDLPAADIPLGTRDYTAPEVAAGERPSEHSDLFSAAIIIHQLLTGSLPWQGHYQKAGHKPLPDLQGQNAFVPLWVNNVLRIGLQRQPGQRFRDAAEFRDALRRPLHRDAPLPDNYNRELRIWKGLCVILVVLLMLSVALK